MKTETTSHLLCTYGPPKLGKTSDLGFTFPTGYFFAPSQSSVAPLRKLCGFEPKVAIVHDTTKIIEWLRTHREDEKVDGVVIDDLALIAEESVKKWAKQSGDGFYRWVQLNEFVAEMCEIARYAPWHMVIDSHEVGPSEAKNTWIPGGPKMPSKPAGDVVAKNAGCILRAVVSDGSVTACDEEWPVYYSCDRRDPNFTVGDRNGYALKQNPLNLREILHAGGISLPRIYPWQEEAVEVFSQSIEDGKLTEEILEKSCNSMASKYKASATAIDWTLRDARARAYMRTHKGDRRKGLIASMVAAQGAL